MRDYKVCAGELGCKRTVLLTYGLCSVHAQRRQTKGITTAQHPLRPRQRRPYIQAAFSWLKSRIRRDDITVLQTIIHFDSFLRLHSEHIHIGDLSRRRVNSHRKLQGVWSNILKRWPKDHQAAIVILSVVLATRLACRVEPDITRHPAFTRAMQLQAVYSLVRRKNIKDLYTMNRPKLSGRWLATRLDDAVEPFIRFMCPSVNGRDNAILAKVATRQYIKVRWESLSSKYLIPNHKRTRRGHPCPWRGKTGPTKGMKYNVR